MKSRRLTLHTILFASKYEPITIYSGSLRRQNDSPNATIFHLHFSRARLRHSGSNHLAIYHDPSRIAATMAACLNAYDSIEPSGRATKVQFRTKLEGELDYAGTYFGISQPKMNPSFATQSYIAESEVSGAQHCGQCCAHKS